MPTHIDALASIGVEHAALSWVRADGSQHAHLGRIPLATLRSSLPFWCEGSRERGTGSLVLRPGPAAATLVQLDDIADSALARLAPLSLFTLATSPAGRQAWLAVDNTIIARTIRQTLQVDLGASGAYRVPGSLNCKERYAPAYPTVILLSVQPGRIATETELRDAGVLADAAPADACNTEYRGDRPPGPPSYLGTWPDYGFFLGRAQPARGHRGPDRSRVDFIWSKTAIARGFPRAEIAARLTAVSAKAAERLLAGDTLYAEAVVTAAARALTA